VSWSLGRAARIGLSVLLVAALAGGAALAVGVIQLSQRHAQVEAGVKGSWPSICSEVGGTLEIKARPLTWFTVWDVNCINSYRPGTLRQFEVNVLTCQARLAAAAPSTLRQLVTDYLRPGLPMTVCP
jgi:hypothetical protein